MLKFLMSILVFVIINTSYSQSVTPFGPRAGIGYLNDNGKSSLEDGIHSAFGWQVEVPFKDDKLTGYGEAGIYLLGIEQGKFFPHVWGYFGVRYNNTGLGAGPVLNAMGFGIGLSAYNQIELDRIRVPIGIDVNLIDGTTRTQLFIGFNFK